MIRFVIPYSDDSFDFKNPEVSYYDDIVDRTDFRPDSETLRGYKLSNGAGVTDSGNYDYPEGDTSKDTVTPELIALRNGRLDRAEVQKLSEATDKALKETADLARKEKLQADEEALSKARQAYLDASIGFNAGEGGKDNG